MSRVGAGSTSIQPEHPPWAWICRRVASVRRVPAPQTMTDEGGCRVVRIGRPAAGDSEDSPTSGDVDTLLLRRPSSHDTATAASSSRGPEGEVTYLCRDVASCRSRSSTHETKELPRCARIITIRRQDEPLPRVQNTRFRATGASVTGATAVGPRLLGPSAIAAVAIGACAVGAMAVGRLAIADAVIRRLRAGEIEIGSLKVRELEIDGRRWPETPAAPTTSQ